MLHGSWSAFKKSFPSHKDWGALCLCVLFCLGPWEQHPPLCCSGAAGQPELAPLPLWPWRWHQLAGLQKLYFVFDSHPGVCWGSGSFGNEGLKGFSKGFYKRDEWAANSTGGAGILVQRSKAGSVALKNSDNWWQCILSLICFCQSAARAVICSKQIAVSWKFDQASKLWLSQWRALPSADIHLLLVWNTQSAELVCSFLQSSGLQTCSLKKFHEVWW